MAEVVVGLDIGTTSVKAVAVDPEGSVLARAQVPHSLGIPQPDRMEHVVSAAWCDGPRQALAAVDHRAEAVAVAVAAMVPSLGAVDASGRGLTPGILYGDARGRGHDVGLPPGMNGEAIGFLSWTVDAAPDAHGYWPAQAVANFALSGEAALDQASAASVYPLYDGTGWSAEHLEACGARPAQMPRVEPLGGPAGRVGERTLLASGLVDALGEQVVAGADEPGDVLVVCGTTLLSWVVLGEYREVDGLWTIPHTAPGRFLLGGASNAGGLFLGWVRRVVGLEQAEDPTGRVDPGSVPVWEPYLRGERTPLHDPDRRGGLHDLDLTHGSVAILRAAYEAAGFVVRHHYDLAGVAPRRVVASGGGTRDRAWMQALADTTGLPVDLVAVPEGGALGAAFVARLAAGLEDELAAGRRWARVGETIEPDPRWAAATGERYARFRELAGR